MQSVWMWVENLKKIDFFGWVFGILGAVSVILFIGMLTAVAIYDDILPIPINVVIFYISSLAALWVMSVITSFNVSLNAFGMIWVFGTTVLLAVGHVGIVILEWLASTIQNSAY